MWRTKRIKQGQEEGETYQSVTLTTSVSNWLSYKVEKTVHNREWLGKFVCTMRILLVPYNRTFPSLEPTTTLPSPAVAKHWKFVPRENWDNRTSTYSHSGQLSVVPSSVKFEIATAACQMDFKVKKLFFFSDSPWSTRSLQFCRAIQTKSLFRALWRSLTAATITFASVTY